MHSENVRLDSFEKLEREKTMLDQTKISTLMELLTELESSPKIDSELKAKSLDLVAEIKQFEVTEIDKKTQVNVQKLAHAMIEEFYQEGRSFSYEAVFFCKEKLESRGRYRLYWNWKYYQDMVDEFDLYQHQCNVRDDVIKHAFENEVRQQLQKIKSREKRKEELIKITRKNLLTVNQSNRRELKSILDMRCSAIEYHKIAEYLSSAVSVHTRTRTDRGLCYTEIDEKCYDEFETVYDPNWNKDSKISSLFVHKGIIFAKANPAQKQYFSDFTEKVENQMIDVSITNFNKDYDFKGWVALMPNYHSQKLPKQVFRLNHRAFKADIWTCRDLVCNVLLAEEVWRFDIKSLHSFVAQATKLVELTQQEFARNKEVIKETFELTKMVAQDSNMESSCYDVMRAFLNNWKISTDESEKVAQGNSAEASWNKIRLENTKTGIPTTKELYESFLHFDVDIDDVMWNMRWDFDGELKPMFNLENEKDQREFEEAIEVGQLVIDELNRLEKM